MMATKIYLNTDSNILMAYRKRRFSHAKELYYILCFAVALVIFLYGLIGPGGYLELRKQQLELARRERQIEELRRTVERQMQAVKALKHDPAAQERFLREKGYAREGELIQELPPEKPAAKQ